MCYSIFVLIFLLFLLGLSVGSFLNVLIDRLPRDESVLKGRSYCESCRKILKWYDLIPVISFIILKGRCRYCRSPISVYYPIVEVITGITFVLVYSYLLNPANFQFSVFSFQFILNYLYHLFIASSLIVIFFTDLKYGILPDKIVYPAIVIAIIYNLQLTINNNSNNLTIQQLSNHLFSAIFSFLFFLFLYFITKGKGMGFGDVKLVFLLGIFLGFPKIVVALYVAFLTGAIIGSILIIWKKKRFKGATIPFGPFLVLGTFLALFLGDKLIQIALTSINF